MNTSNTNNTVTKKTIPKKTMGYLKFAYFIIQSQTSENSTLQNLFLDKSIDQIITIVNDVVTNGDQDVSINDLRKQFINSTKPNPKPKSNAKPRNKPKTKNIISIGDSNFSPIPYRSVPYRTLPFTVRIFITLAVS